MPSSTDRPESRSLAAGLAAGAGVLAVVAAALGPLLVHAGVLGSRRGIGLFFLGVCPGMLLALVLGAIGLRRTRRGARRGRGAAWTGFVAGAALLGLVLSFRPWTLWVTLHDATTNIEDPPLFSDEVRARRARRGVELRLPRVNTTDYPSPSPDHPPPISREQVIAYQRTYYPDLAPIELPDTPPADAFQAAQGVARDLGWTLTAVDPRAGVLEAFDLTPFFRFEDDVVVRVRTRAAGGSVVDVRSTSLYRANDLRSNANRIRTFARRLRERVWVGPGPPGP